MLLSDSCCKEESLCECRQFPSSSPVGGMEGGSGDGGYSQTVQSQSKQGSGSQTKTVKQ